MQIWELNLIYIKNKLFHFGLTTGSFFTFWPLFKISLLHIWQITRDKKSMWYAQWYDDVVRAHWYDDLVRALTRQDDVVRAAMIRWCGTRNDMTMWYAHWSDGCYAATFDIRRAAISGMWYAQWYDNVVRALIRWMLRGDIWHMPRGNKWNVVRALIRRCGTHKRALIQWIVRGAHCTLTLIDCKFRYFTHRVLVFMMTPIINVTLKFEDGYIKNADKLYIFASINFTCSPCKFLMKFTE